MFEHFVGHPVSIDGAVCTSERVTGHRNRAIAMAMLKARLYEQELQKREAAAAVTEADALAYVDYARMLAYYQINGGGLVRVVTASRYPTLANAGNAAVLALPVDYLAWTAGVAAAAEILREIREREGFDEFLLLLAGRPTERAARELAGRRVEVRADYSF